MEENSSTPEENSSIQFDFGEFENFKIPIDLFVSKKQSALGTKGFLKFTDSAHNLIYKVHKSASDKRVKLVQDASGNTLFSIHRDNKRSWQCFRGGDSGRKILKVERTIDDSNRSEFKVLVDDENDEDSKFELMMIGSPFKRACTIYKGDSIVAESSLMYKLGIKKVLVPRNRFRVTIFPGVTDHVLVVSLIVIFFDRRKLWI